MSNTETEVSHPTASIFHSKKQWLVRCPKKGGESILCKNCEHFKCGWCTRKGYMGKLYQKKKSTFMGEDL